MKKGKERKKKKTEVARLASGLSTASVQAAGGERIKTLNKYDPTPPGPSVSSF